MIRLAYGNMFNSQVDALVNTVNSVGVMGAGVALQFRICSRIMPVAVVMVRFVQDNR